MAGIGIGRLEARLRSRWLGQKHLKKLSKIMSTVRILTFRIRSQYLPRSCLQNVHDMMLAQANPGYPAKRVRGIWHSSTDKKEHQQSNIHPRFTQLCALHLGFPTRYQFLKAQEKSTWVSCFGIGVRQNTSVCISLLAGIVGCTWDQWILGLDSEMNDVIRTDSARHKQKMTATEFIEG